MSEENKTNFKPLKDVPLIRRVKLLLDQLPQLATCKSTLYFYNNTHYEELTEEMLGQYVFDFFKDTSTKQYTPKASRDIMYAIPFHENVKRVKEFDNQKNLINLNNGVYNFDTKELIPHSPEQLFTTCINVDYDPTKTEAPHFVETLKGIFANNDGTSDTTTIGNIIKLGGYLLYPKNIIPKLFILFGTGSNGKSIIMDNVFKTFFDKKFISALSLNTLSNENSTARKQLLISRVNFATEQKAGDIESEELKKIVSGEDIAIERKYRDNITHRPKTKVIVAANRLPRFKDHTYGTDRRLMIINFPNKFVPEEEYNKIENPLEYSIYKQKNQEEIISNLKKEKSAILNMFLESLELLKEDSWRFKTSANTDKIFQDYKDESDPNGEWIKSSFKTNKESYLLLDEIYDMYRLWYGENNPTMQYILTKRTLASRIKDIFRIESNPINIKDNSTGKWSTTVVFYLKHKDKNEDIKEVTDIIDDTTPEQTSLEDMNFS